MGVILDNDYRSAASHLLSPYGNLDNDGQFNIEEWQESGNDVEAYLARILDDERAPDESLLDPSGATRYVEECDDCVKTTVWLDMHSTDVGNLGDAEFVVMIDGKIVIDPEQDGEEIAYGRWVDVVAKADESLGYQFDQWNAPGTLLDGERSRRARFMLIPDTTSPAKSGGNANLVAAQFYRGFIDVPVDNAMVDYTFTPNGNVVGPETVSYSGQTFHRYRGPFGSSVSGSYEIQPDYDPGEGLNAYKSGWTVTAADTVEPAITANGGTGGAARPLPDWQQLHEELKGRGVTHSPCYPSVC